MTDDEKVTRLLIEVLLGLGCDSSQAREFLAVAGVTAESEYRTAAEIACSLVPGPVDFSAFEARKEAGWRRGRESAEEAGAELKREGGATS